MNKILAALIMSTISCTSAFASSGTRGGGFADFSPKPALLRLKSDLARDIRALPIDSFQTISETPAPKEWDTKRVADVIDSLQIDSSARSLTVESDGRLKILDFNSEQNSIQVLAAFFLYYGRELSREKIDQETITDIRRKLIHEVAHLWGQGDDQALKTSDSILWKLEHDILACNFDVDTSKDGKGRKFLYSFGDERIYFAAGQVDMDNDAADPSLPMKNDWYMGTLLPSQKIEGDMLIVGGGNREDVIKVKRVIDKKDGDDTVITHGTAQFFHYGTGRMDAEEKITCSIANPR